ncbi:MAG: hypothetical protein AB8G22_19580 [Saprospiraceae bacterium]
MQSKAFTPIFFLFFLAFSATAQVSVRAALDTNAILIGEQVGLNITVNHPPNTQVKDAQISVVSEVENLEVVSISDWDTLATSPQLILAKELVLTSFDSGYYFIPPIPVEFLEYGLDKQYQTQQLALAVNTVPQADTLQLADIKGIIIEPRTWEDFIKPIAGVSLFLILFAIAWYFWKNRKPEEVAPVPVVKIPAHELALSQLSTLKNDQLWQKGEIKEYQSRLTRIIREYLENRYEVNALESTTDQILRDLKQVDFNVDWKEKLREMLQMADLVKFAKAEPPADFHGRMLENAEAFVRQTKQEIILENNENV